MSIFEAVKLAKKGDKAADAAFKAARKCNRKTAEAKAKKAKALLDKAEKLRDAHDITTASGKAVKRQFDAIDECNKFFFRGTIKLIRVRGQLRACADLERALCLAKEAVKSAKACDIERVERLRVLSKNLVRYFKKYFPKASSATGDKALKTLKKIERLLKKCAKQKPIYPFKEGGTFKGTKAGLDTQIMADEKTRIEYLFRPGKKIECASLTFVQVLHCENPDDCNKIFVEPSDAGAPFAMGPSALDVADGHVVDTRPNNEHPGYTRQCRKTFTLKNGDKVVGLFGVDEPSGLNSPNECYFEMAAMCFDTNPPTVLQTMRWVHFVDSKAKETSRILKRNGKIDWGAPSGPFQKALKFWLKQKRPGVTRRLPKDTDVKPC